jgi:ribulose-phosphate 3-epimerase
MPEQLAKLKALRGLIDGRNPRCALEVDGGVNPETARLCRENGASVLVAGSDIFGARDRAARIEELRGGAV